MDLMTEKFCVVQGLSAKSYLQKRAELPRLELFSLSDCQIRQRRLEGFQFFAAQLIIEPGCPFFFKRFHTRPSGNSAISYGHKTVATSPCRWNNPTFRRFRDTAFLQFLSSKLLLGVRGKVGRSPCRSDRELRRAPFAGAEGGPLLAQSWTRGQSLLTESNHRTRRLRL